MAKTITYEEWLAKVRAKPVIVIHGATPEEVSTIKTALNLLHTRAHEKHIAHSNMGWDKQAATAEELEVRIA